MGTYARSTWSFAAFLIVGSPMPAPAQEQPPLKMVYAVWKDQGGAANTMAEMNKKTYDLVEAWAVIVKDSAGNVKVTQRGNKAGGDPRAMEAAETIDTAVARLSALPSNPDSAAGYEPAPGSPASRLSKKDLKRVATMLHPGESAVLLISPKPNVSEVQRFMGMGAPATPGVVVLDLQ